MIRKVRVIIEVLDGPMNYFTLSESLSHRFLMGYHINVSFGGFDNHTIGTFVADADGSIDLVSF